MRKLFLFIIAEALMLAGCGGGGLDMMMKPTTGFKLTSSVAVECDSYDSANLRQRIEEALFRNGVNVISPPFAQTDDQLQSDSANQLSAQSSKKKADTTSARSSTPNRRATGAEYLLKFKYNFDYTLSGKVITDFSATIVAPGTGEVVGMISYHGNGEGSLPDELANSVGKKLSQQLK